MRSPESLKLQIRYGLWGCCGFLASKFLSELPVGKAFVKAGSNPASLLPIVGKHVTKVSLMESFS